MAPSSDSLSLRLRASWPLTSPVTATRRFIMQKARGHTTGVLPPLEGAWFQGLFHSSARGAFHLSLTRFPQNSSCSAVLRCRLADRLVFRVRGCHPLWRQFPQASATLAGPARRRSYNPGRGLDRPGLGSCAFARHYLRNHCYFLFLRVLRCFSSPRSPPRNARMTGSLPPGFPIRTSPGRCAFAAHRRFSQLVTSFVASESHRHPPCALRNFPCSFFRSLRHASNP